MNATSAGSGQVIKLGTDPHQECRELRNLAVLRSNERPQVVDTGVGSDNHLDCQPAHALRIAHAGARQLLCHQSEEGRAIRVEESRDEQLIKHPYGFRLGAANRERAQQWQHGEPRQGDIVPLGKLVADHMFVVADKHLCSRALHENLGGDSGI